MANSTVTQLQGKDLFITQLELVTPTTVAGTLYGIAFTLFCLYVHALVPRLRNGDRTIQAKFILAYSTVIMLCGVCYLVSNAWVDQDAYIKHSNYPGGPLSYVLSSYRTTPVIPIGLVCQMAIDILTMAIQIWRVWVIWRATRYAALVVVLPALCLLSFTGLRLRTIILEITLPLVEVGQLDDSAEQAEIAIQGAATILCTVLISLYLIFKQWQQRKLIGKSQGFTGYMNIVAMMIESYALESIWLLTLIIVWSQPASSFFGESAPYIEIIAYLLVQYRVARGEAYESHGERQDISSLRWNHSNHVTTQFGETGEVQRSPHVSTALEASNDAGVARMA